MGLEPPVETVTTTDLELLVETVTATGLETLAEIKIPMDLVISPASVAVTVPAILKAPIIPLGINQVVGMIIAPAKPGILAMAELPLDMVTMIQAGPRKVFR